MPFLPVVLEGVGVKKLDAIVNGFLTVNEKMSKSRGTFIKARTYLDHLDPEYLRYYFAYKSSAWMTLISIQKTFKIE